MRVVQIFILIADTHKDAIAIQNAGINIVNSCQESNPRKIWIWFSQVEDLKRFVDILVDGIGSHVEENNCLLGRVIANINSPGGCWEYSILPFIIQHKVDDDIDIQISPSLWFPVKDYDAVLKIFRNVSKICPYTLGC